MTELRATAIPPNWSQVTIGDVVASEISQEEPDNSQEKFIYIDIGSVDNQQKQIVNPKFLHASEAPSRARQQLRGFDVLVSMTRPNLNAVAIVPSKYSGSIASTGFRVLRAIQINPKWLFYLVQTTAFVESMSLLVQGALYPAVRPKDIDAYTIPIPPLQEQHRIVEEIDTQFSRLDDAVANLKRVEVELERLRAATLQAACEGRLVPTEAELAQHEGREYEPADELLTRIVQMRRDNWESEQLARMQMENRPPRNDHWKSKYRPLAKLDTFNLPTPPKGWAWAPLRVLAELKGGMAKDKSRHANVHLRSVPYLRVANVQRGFLDLREIKHIGATDDEIDQLKLLTGDILFNEGGDRDKLGRGWIWNGELAVCIHQNHVFRGRLLLKEMEPKYISYYSNSIGQRYFLDQGAQTTNLASISLAKLGALPIPLPPLDEQHRIVAEVERRLSIIDEIVSSVRTMLGRSATLRQEILRRGFEGKLVPQDPSDEPASVLLERIRAEKALHEEKTKLKRKARKDKMPGKKRESRAPSRRPLHDVMAEADSPMTPKELFDRAGFGVDMIDEFYEELRREVIEERRIEQVRDEEREIYLTARAR